MLPGRLTWSIPIHLPAQTACSTFRDPAMLRTSADVRFWQPVTLKSCFPSCCIRYGSIPQHQASLGPLLSLGDKIPHNSHWLTKLRRGYRTEPLLRPSPPSCLTLSRLALKVLLMTEPNDLYRRTKQPITVTGVVGTFGSLYEKGNGYHFPHPLTGAPLRAVRHCSDEGH